MKLERRNEQYTILARILLHMRLGTIYFFSKMDPLKYIIQKAMPIGKLEKWQVLLSEFDIVCVT